MKKNKSDSKKSLKSAIIHPRKLFLGRGVGRTKEKRQTANWLFSMRTKLISAFLATVIPIVLLGYISYNSAFSAINETAADTSLETMRQVDKYIGLLLSGVEDLSMQIYREQGFQEYISSVYEDSNEEITALQKKVYNSLMNYRLNSKMIDDIYIILDNNRSVSASKVDMQINQNSFQDIKKSQLFSEATERNGEAFWVGSHTELNQYTSRSSSYALSLVKPLRNMHGSGNQLIGILMIDIKYITISDTLKNTNFGNGSELHLISPDFRDIAHVVNNESSEILDTSVENNQIIPQELFSKIIGGESGEFLIDDYKGQEHLILHTYIGNTGYVLIGLTPTVNFADRALGIKNITNLLTIIAAAFAILIGLFLALNMDRAIKNIIDYSNKAADGDFTVSLKTKRRDELGILAKSFSMMISNMRELIVGAKETADTVIDLAGTVNGTSKEVKSVSHEVSRAVEEIAKGAGGQAEDAEQSSIKMGELATKINAVSDFATTIEAYSKDTINFTKQGFSSVIDLKNKAEQTTEITKGIISDIQDLDNNTKSISKVVKVIEEIADQTNLLALNAAIEAARAGDAGRGFAVVAEEIRKLAEQSALSTKEITEIVRNNNIQTGQIAEKATYTGDILASQNKAMENTLDAFTKISDSMDSLSHKVDDISAGVKDMDSNKEDVLLSIQEISSASEEIAASTEEVIASTQEQLSSIDELSNFAQQLNDAAKILQEAIKRFTV